VSFPSVE